MCEDAKKLPDHGKLTPLHLFRKDYMMQHKASRSNWMSREAWAEIKDAFGRLEPAVCRRYDAQCVLNRDKSQHSRQLRSLQPEPQRLLDDVVIGSVNGVAVPPHGVVASANPASLQPGENMVEALGKPRPIFGDLLPPDFDALNQAAESVESLQSAERTTISNTSLQQEVHWPVEESNVLASLVGAHATHSNLARAGKEFTKRSQVIAGPDGTSVFPNKVEIHGKCGQLCLLETTMAERTLFDKIVSGLAAMVSSGTPIKMVQADILLAVVSTHCNNSKSVQYFYVSGISCKGGYQKPDAVHISCRVLNRSSDDFETKTS